MPVLSLAHELLSRASWSRPSRVPTHAARTALHCCRVALFLALLFADNVLAQEVGLKNGLLKVDWLRVVLDEAHRYCSLGTTWYSLQVAG